MEITIGLQHVGRELTLESDQSADQIAKAVTAAASNGLPLDLLDNRGRRTIVAPGALAYVQIGAETRTRVGFGTD